MHNEHSFDYREVRNTHVRRWRNGWDLEIFSTLENRDKRTFNRSTSSNSSDASQSRCQWEWLRNSRSIRKVCVARWSLRNDSISVFIGHRRRQVKVYLRMLWKLYPVNASINAVNYCKMMNDVDCVWECIRSVNMFDVYHVDINFISIVLVSSWHEKSVFLEISSRVDGWLLHSHSTWSVN